ncbi:MAG: hypothetical protein ACK4ZP_06150 [Bacteroidota bacterium]
MRLIPHPILGVCSHHHYTETAELLSPQLLMQNGLSYQQQLFTEVQVDALLLNLGGCKNP